MNDSIEGNTSLSETHVSDNKNYGKYSDEGRIDDDDEHGAIIELPWISDDTYAHKQPNHTPSMFSRDEKHTALVVKKYDIPSWIIDKYNTNRPVE